MYFKNRNRIGLAAAIAFQALALLALTGCSDRDLDDLVEATADAQPNVFIDGFSAGLDYAAFENSFYESLTIDESNGVDGSTALRFDVLPEQGVPGTEGYNPGWIGGSFYSQGPRDLSSFNALTFQARATQAIELNEVGFGIGIIADADFQCKRNNVAVGTAWTDVVIPIPDPERLVSERGMFWLSDASDGATFTVWFDNVRFANVAGITNPVPSIPTLAVQALLGETVPISGTTTTFTVGSEDVEVIHTPAYFDFASSDTTVAQAEGSVVTAVGGGEATINATLAGVTAQGEVSVTVIGPPDTPAPTPTEDEADVISLFSDAFATNVEVDTWLTDWAANPGPAYDQQIGDDNVKAYLNLRSGYVAIDFTTNQIDAATPGMTHFRLDVFADEGSIFYVKLADFGPNGVFGGGDDTEKLIIFSSVSDPAYVPGQWVTLDIPLTQFTGMNFGNVSQLVLESPNVGNIWVDNIYFHR